MTLDSNKEQEYEYREASYLQRLFSGLIDAALAILIVFLVVRYGVPAPLYQLAVSINPSLFALIMLVLYRVLALVLLGRTTGMFLLGIILLNGSYQRLSIVERLLAAFFILYRGVDYYRK